MLGSDWGFKAGHAGKSAGAAERRVQAGRLGILLEEGGGHAGGGQAGQGSAGRLGLPLEQGWASEDTRSIMSSSQVPNTGLFLTICSGGVECRPKPGLLRQRGPRPWPGRDQGRPARLSQRVAGSSESSQVCCIVV